MPYLESLVAPTHFGMIRRHLTRPASPITDVLFVASNGLLSQVADLLTEKLVPTATQRVLRGWLQSGRVQLGVNAAQPASANASRNLIDVQAIPDETLCRVLYVPPFCLVYRVN